jgi:1-deoxy-D-xylulose-5-phosphate reductoisomerase
MDCAKRGGNICAAMNGANEEAVALFLADKIRFYDIYDLVSGAVAAAEFIPEPTLEQILETDRLARSYVQTNH